MNNMLKFLIFLPYCLCICNDKTCRSSDCCAERDCSSNPTDPFQPNSLTCPCMISLTFSSCFSLGTTAVLNCDPGGVCQDHCSWSTPVGLCTSTTMQCQDESVRFVDEGETCSIEIVGVQAKHQGTWRCQSTPYITTFSDFINITSESGCSVPSTTSSSEESTEDPRNNSFIPVIHRHQMLFIILSMVANRKFKSI